MGAAAAAVLIKERHIIEAFERNGATSAQRGVTPEDILVHQYGVGWRRLRHRNIILETSPDSGKFYVDLEAWVNLRQLRRRVLFVAVFFAAMASAAVIMSSAMR